MFINGLYIRYVKYTDAQHLIYLIHKIKVLCMTCLRYTALVKYIDCVKLFFSERGCVF